jgi:hypothetical protein
MQAFSMWAQQPVNRYKQIDKTLAELKFHRQRPRILLTKMGMQHDKAMGNEQVT